MKPVVILGAGINGAAVARDLAINGIPVCLVDTGDVARGATSRSSRLIHGGLRYLEYRDFELVRESLREREQLLKLAPQFVKPLRLTIPVSGRSGGLWAGFVRFSGLARTATGQFLLKAGRGRRGLLAIRTGLSIYDWLAQTDLLPGHQIQSIPARRSELVNDHIPAVPPEQFRWACSYSDAQIEYPERFVFALLDDAKRAAAASGVTFELHPYCRAVRSESGKAFEVLRVNEQNRSDHADPTQSIDPSVIINATGAWGDQTLQSLGVDEQQLFAGTKGSHLFTTHFPLIEALNGNGIYAEAPDGRLVFILPCAGGVLIGTTDDPYTGDPALAVSTPADVDYLVNLVNEILPNAGLTADHVNLHHAGVRPLPRSDSSSASAIPRGHTIHESSLNGIPVLTLIGGKLTTCRSLADQVCSTVCRKLGRKQVHDTSDRPISGARDFPDRANLNHYLQMLSERHALTAEQVEMIWPLVGNRFDEIFSRQHTASAMPENHVMQQPSIAGTDIPAAFVNWSIEHEWVTKLEDLIERRLMMIFHQPIHRETLLELGRALIETNRLKASQLESEVARVISRLQNFYGKTVTSD